MRYGIQWEGRGRVGLIIFTADTLDHAIIFCEELNSRGQERAFNLNELTEGTVGELMRLYPRVTHVTVNGNVTMKGQ